MKQNKKIELRFMDLVVKLEGGRGLENRAWSLLAVMIQDRLKLMELTQGYDECEGDTGPRQSKKKKLQPDIEFERLYA